MDLYDLFSLSDIKDFIMSYLCKYNDNIYIFRMLCKSFYYLPLYHKFKVENVYCKNKYISQSKSYIQNFLKINKIKKLYINKYNKHIYVNPTFYSHLQKIKVDSLSEKQFYFFVKYFSKFSIQNLKLNYIEFKYPDILLKFNQLKTLDITITCKENEDIIFELLKVNQDTLRKLKIGIYTEKGIDEQKLVQIIKNFLKLEYINIRGDLFSYDMIKSNMKIIINPFKFDFSKINTLKYLYTLRLNFVKNVYLEPIFSSLEIIETLSLYGISSNYETYNDEIYEKYQNIISKSNYDEDHEEYDYTVGKIIIKSPNLNHIFLSDFTIEQIELPVENSLKSIYINDVCFKKEIYLPKLIEFTVENSRINPENVDLKLFKFPKLKDISIHHCIIKDVFNNVHSK